MAKVRKVLLLNVERNVVRSPNLSLGYLATCLEIAGHEVAIVDVAKRRVGADSIDKALREEDWDVIGLSVYSSGHKVACGVARKAKGLCPGAVVVAGGLHPSALPSEVLRDEPAFDCVLVGDAENTFPELVSRAEGPESSFAGVPGAYWREAGEIKSEPGGVPPDLHEVPLPAWHLISPLDYPRNPAGAFVKAFPVAPMITTRGCPYLCTFCCAANDGTAMRYREPEAVVDEVEFLVGRYGVREIQFLDDNFTFRRSHASQVCEMILSRGIKVAISMPNGVRLDRLDKELIQLMERAGCYALTVGVDSGVQAILDAMRRSVTLEKMEEQVNLIKDSSSIAVTGNFILGLPGETARDIDATIRYARQLRLDRAQFAYYLPLPGSPLFTQLREEGKLDDIDYGNLSWSSSNLPYAPEGMTTRELRRQIIRAYISFYGRSRILTAAAREVRNLEHAVFLAKKTLGRIIGV